MNKTVMIVTLALATSVGCAGEDRHVKTQEERLEAQMALADEQVAEQEEQNSRFDEAESETEKAEAFDREQAEYELRRATLNASDCPNTFDKSQLEDFQPGEATLQVTFRNDGTVKNATIAAPYDGTNVGDCVLRAINSVQLKMFSGDEVTMDWTVKLEVAKKEAKKTDAKK